MEDKEAELIAIRNECTEKLQQAQTAVDEMLENVKVTTFFSDHFGSPFQQILGKTRS